MRNSVRILTKLFVAVLGATTLGLHSASAVLVTLNVDASFDGIADSGQVPIGTAAGNSVIFGSFATLNNAAITGFNTGGVTPAEVMTLLMDFRQIGPAVTMLDFGPGTDGLFFQTLNLADNQDAPVPADGTTFANYQANFATMPVYMIVQTLDEIGVFTSGTNFAAAQDTTLFTDFESNFGVGSGGLDFNPLIGGNPAVINGSVVDTQGMGAADGFGAFGSGFVVTTTQIVPEPSSAFLVAATGLLGLVRRRRRG